jgi:hypothetical protein
VIGAIAALIVLENPLNAVVRTFAVFAFFETITAREAKPMIATAMITSCSPDLPMIHLSGDRRNCRFDDTRKTIGEIRDYICRVGFFGNDDCKRCQSDDGRKNRYNFVPRFFHRYCTNDPEPAIPDRLFKTEGAELDD